MQVKCLKAWGEQSSPDIPARKGIWGTTQKAISHWMHGPVARSEGRDATFMYILLRQNLNGSYLIIIICSELRSTD